MTARLIRCGIAALTFSLIAASSPAQQLPAADQAKRLLETRPDLVAALRRELTSSGLSADQVRARLRSLGYPEDILDPYLAGTSRASDSLSSAIAPNDRVIDAVAALGITDSAGTSDLRDQLRGRRPRADRDSAAADRNEALGPIRSTIRQVLQVADSGKTLFGLNVFANATTQFDPNLAGPVDENYRLGPGDRLVLIITGDAERSFQLDVTREGFIVVPGIGELAVGNLTLAQAENLLFPKLARVYSGLRRDASATTHASLNVARLHSNQIFVLGDVEQPGSYRVSSAGTALTALYAAGGPTRGGTLRRVEVRRAGRLVDTLDLYDYLLRADASHDVRLQSGDAVFVPVHGARVRVYGEIVRPATYELRRGETLADLLRAAGGFTAEAARRRVQISRILPPGQRDTTDRARIVIDIASSAFATGTGPAYPLEPGDVVQVFAVNDRVTRKVMVDGDVWSPGTVGFTAGMRLSDALRMAGGIKPDAYLEHVLIARLRPSDSTRVQLRSALADSTGRPVEDIALREDDEIHVFARTEFKADQFVAITGAVRRPGAIPFREGMTMRDLILMAGGLDERALIGEAEIARVPLSRDGGRLAETVRVPLDSSYVLASQSNRAVPAGAPVALRPYDNVLILAQPDWERPRRVTVTGEVRFPGTYTLTSKQERLDDVIRRAGGVTPAAYVDGVMFFRNDGHTGRIGIDLPRVLRDPGFRDNMLVQDGDSIHLPTYNGIVLVQGAVNATRGVAYVPGADLFYYVRAAGGPSRVADAKRAYVTQPDGNVESVVVRRFWPDAVPVPRPGAIVVVAERDPNEQSQSLQQLTITAQVIGGLVALVALLRQI